MPHSEILDHVAIAKYDHRLILNIPRTVAETSGNKVFSSLCVNQILDSRGIRKVLLNLIFLLKDHDIVLIVVLSLRASWCKPRGSLTNFIFLFVPNIMELILNKV